MIPRALILILLLAAAPTRASVLPLSEVIQEQGQWCWAAVSRSILLYYGHDLRQCEIAEYSRTVSTLRDLGQVNCCTDPNQGCNQWHYYGKTKGSIADILDHYGALGARGIEWAVTDAEVDSEINKNARPLVVRWLKASGSGHFVVAHGLDKGVLSYMDPLEGKKVAQLSWVRNGAHKWTHTTYLTTTCRCTNKKDPCCDGCKHLAAGTTCPGGTCQVGVCVPATPDAAVPDATLPDLALPDAAASDALTPDSGGAMEEDEGCGVAGGSTSPPPLAILLLLALLRLRRGRCPDGYG